MLGWSFIILVFKIIIIGENWTLKNAKMGDIQQYIFDNLKDVSGNAW